MKLKLILLLALVGIFSCGKDKDNGGSNNNPPTGYFKPCRPVLLLISILPREPIR